MTQNIDLKEIEKKVWTSYFEDGIWDIFLGLLILGMGLAPLLEDIGMGLSEYWIISTMLPAMIFLFVGKKYIAIPRMGVVKFGPKRKAKLKKMQAILFIVLILGLIIGILVATSIISPELAKGISIPILVWIGVFIIGFSLAAYLLDFNRLYLYGVLYAIPHPARMMLKHTDFAGISLSIFFVSAAVMVAIGMVLLIRFLRKYPLPEEVSND